MAVALFLLYELTGRSIINYIVIYSNIPQSYINAMDSTRNRFKCYSRVIPYNDIT